MPEIKEKNTLKYDGVVIRVKKCPHYNCTMVMISKETSEKAQSDIDDVEEAGIFGFALSDDLLNS